MEISGKRARHFCYAFTYARGETLFECYKSPSAGKIEAYERCREKCYSQGGLQLLHSELQHFWVYLRVGNIPAFHRVHPTRRNP